MANRYIKGENNPKAKMTVEKVQEDRVVWELYQGQKDPLPGKPNNRVASIGKLARLRGISYSAMRSILTRETWRHV